MLKSFYISCILVLGYQVICWSQCTPASETNCEDAKVLCSLTELNGFTCRLSSASNTAGCMPICPSGGAPENIEWWAFISEGGNVTISLTISNCTNTTGAIGMEFGLSGNCICSESLACNKLCNGPGTYSISATLNPCKTYYLFVDGCNGDVCDYTIQTSGGNTPNLFPLGKINDDADRIIPVCRTCDFHHFYVKHQSNGCTPNYEWTINGIPLGAHENSIETRFPEEGDFQLCVTAYIGNPQSGAICDQEGPECATIQVRQIPDKTSGIRYLCPESIPYKWHDQYIINSGVYKTKLCDKQTCYFDSVVQFQILPVPIIPKIYHIGCNSADVFIDPTSRKVFKTCQIETPILIKKSSYPYKCDSTYELTAIFLNQEVTFREDCQDGKIIIQPRILNKAITCGSNEIFEYRYKWYLKQDTNKTSISTDEYYTAIQKNDYCLEIELITTLGPLTKTCFFDYCENLDESIYIKPTGKFSVPSFRFEDLVKQNTHGKAYDVPREKVDATNYDTYQQEIVDTYKVFFNEGYETTKIQGAWMWTGIMAAVYVVFIVFMGLMIWLMTRGKNNPYRIYTFWETQKMSYWAAFTPAVLACGLGFAFSTYALFIFILFYGMRIMWMSMKNLRPEVASK
jgi:hypothetical protein